MMIVHGLHTNSSYTFVDFTNFLVSCILGLLHNSSFNFSIYAFHSHIERLFANL